MPESKEFRALDWEETRAILERLHDLSEEPSDLSTIALGLLLLIEKPSPFNLAVPHALDD